QAEQALDEVHFAILRILENDDVPSLRPEQAAADVIRPLQHKYAITGVGRNRIACRVQAVALAVPGAVRAAHGELASLSVLIEQGSGMDLVSFGHRLSNAVCECEIAG